MKNALLFALAGFIAGSSWLSLPVQARPQFKKVFDDTYVKKAPATPQEKALAEAVSTVQCNVCHVGPNPKVGTKNRNAYGKAVNGLITTKDAINTPKIIEALDQVSKMKSDPNNPNSPTFGELLEQGKLPCENK